MLKEQDISVGLFCGGRQVAFKGANPVVKGLIKIHSVSLVVRVIQHYQKFGFKKFVLGLGLNGEQIQKECQGLNGDLDLQFVETGAESTTGDRLRQMKSHLTDTFALNYTDTLSDINLSHLLSFHQEQNKIGTLLASHMPTRFRVLGMPDGANLVKGFSQFTVMSGDWINGGHYFFEKSVFDLPVWNEKATGLILEDHVLDNLVTKGELVAYRHEGHWHHLDHERDISFMESAIN